MAKNNSPPRTNQKGKGKAPAKPSRAAGKSRGKPAQPQPRPGMSLDRKLDIAGVAMVLVALLSLLTFLSSNRSGPLDWWYQLWAGAFGRAGVYGVPLGLGAAGLWLVLRRFGDRLPKVEPERILGILILFVAFLTTFHFIVTASIDLAYEEGRQGNGGGLVGAVVLTTLFSLVDRTGSAIVLAAIWVIGIMFAASMSVPELAQLVLRGIRKVRGPADESRRAPPDRLASPPSRQRAAAPRTASPPAGPQSSASGKAPAGGASPTGGGTSLPTPLPLVKDIGKREPSRKDGQTPAPPGPAEAAYDQPLIIGGEQHWELPPVAEMLERGLEGSADDEYDRTRARIIEETLAAFGAPVKVVEVNRGPAITQFGVEPDFVPLRAGKQTKVKVGKISALANDLALALAATSIRIEAPVPGKGYVGIEVPNLETDLVSLRDVMESEAFQKIKSSLAIGLGQDVSGQPIAADLAAMPHLLIAGTTGSGKSVCVNSIIACLLLNNTPDDLKLLMVDPKRVELTNYNGIPHLLAPVVVDLERVVVSLQWVTREMDERYRKFAKAGARNIADHNERAKSSGAKKLPFLVVFIDELADLMMLAPDETERTIARLAQLARATGIHIVISTQRPSVDVITGIIKANFPARISFAVASSVDSRVVLDQPGAERLLGRGDMLFQSPDAPAPQRMQGVFVSDAELQRIVRYWKGARGLDEATAVPAAIAASQSTSSEPSRQPPLWEEMREAAAGPGDGQDELLEEAIRAVRELKKASISLLQRRLRIGYTRAARLIDIMEEMGIVGPAQSGAQPREVLKYGEGEEALPAGKTRTWTAAE